jgi:hypothetical protein
VNLPGGTSFRSDDALDEIARRIGGQSVTLAPQSLVLDL